MPTVTQTCLNCEWAIQDAIGKWRCTRYPPQVFYNFLSGREKTLKITYPLIPVVDEIVGSCGTCGEFKKR
jgi:hypothetical protein